MRDTQIVEKEKNAWGCFSPKRLFCRFLVSERRSDTWHEKQAKADDA